VRVFFFEHNDMLAIENSVNHALSQGSSSLLQQKDIVERMNEVQRLIEERQIEAAKKAEESRNSMAQKEAEHREQIRQRGNKADAALQDKLQAWDAKMYQEKTEVPI